MSSRRKEFDRLVESARSSGSTSARLDVLDFAKLHSLHHPAVVLEVGKLLLSAGGLGDRQWDVLEQVTVAALDEGVEKVAAECLDSLKRRFPESQRVQRLQGMYLEAHGKFEEVSQPCPRL